MATNFWFEHVVDAYLQALSQGSDWKKAVTAAERATGDAPRRVLTRHGLRDKGVCFSRQHLSELVRDGRFPPPFQMPGAE